MTTAEKFKTVRTALNITQTELAEKLKVRSSYISSIEKGHKHPSNTLISLLEVVYDINPIWWETGEGDIFLVTKEELDQRRERDRIIADMSGETRAKKLSSSIANIPDLSLRHEMVLRLFDAVDTETQDEVLQLLLKSLPKK